MLCPTLAFAEARALCTDLAALYTGASARLDVPRGGGSSGTHAAAVHYDERVRAQLVLTLPSVPSKLPPRDACGPDALPALLVHLLRALDITLQGAAGGAPLVTRRWHGTDRGAAFLLHGDDADADGADDGACTPLSEDTYAPGATYDAEAKAWRVAWLADVVIRTCPPRETHAAYPSAEPGVQRVVLRAALRLRLDLAQLVTHVDAPAPQTPFHHAAGEPHPFVGAADPYLVDVDLLAGLTEGVTVPDETAEQRHQHIASKLALLPLSALVPGATGVELVAPWSQSTRLADAVARSKEIESAAISSDADIALAPLAAKPPERPGRTPPVRQASMPSVHAAEPTRGAHDVATAAAHAIVVLTRDARATLEVRPTLAVRLRTLSRAHTLAPAAEAGASRVLLLCVELESALDHGTFVVHDVDLALGAGAPGADDAGPPHLARLAPHTDAPIRLGPHAQHNVLYAVHLAPPAHDADALVPHAARRDARVTVRGAPARGADAPPHSTCASQWDGVLDLRVLYAEQQRACAADAALLHAAHYVPDAEIDAPPLVAGDAALAASALMPRMRAPDVRTPDVRTPRAAERVWGPGAPADAREVPAAPVPPYVAAAQRRAARAAPFAAAAPERGRAARHAYAWGPDGAAADAPADAAAARAAHRLLAAVRVAPVGGTPDAVPCGGALDVHVGLSNVSAAAIDAAIAWDAAADAGVHGAPRALRTRRCGCVRLCLGGMRSARCVCATCARGVCVLHHLGSVHVVGA
ncbi:hypothetical protein MOBT1_000304 [Malassezia obtusa]|uniref:Uncharacterized protein n=1 Tax=Malassezia obtusa TaxID=76774 RepID=A0AAF0DW78_9BASI|nr:hypothetical protein MOBT1_000304 [Malassezia obtusa]